MQQRYLGFDVVKGGAIILVVFGHVWRGLESTGMIANEALFTRVDEAIYLFHMPVFFFLSGLFFSASLPAVAFLKLRMQTLLWPMLLWSAADGMARYSAGTLVNGAPITPLQILIPWAPTTGIFWFLWALFFLSLLAYALARFSRLTQLVLMAGLALAALMGWIGAGPYESLWPAFIYMPAFFAGIAMTSLGARQRLLGPGRAGPGLVLFLAGQGILAFGLAQTSQLWSECAMALSTLGFVLCLANLAPPRRILGALNLLGRLTMPIYLTHILFTASSRIALGRIGVDDLAIHLMIGTSAGVLGPMVLYFATRRAGIAGMVGFDRPAKTTHRCPQPVPS